MLSLLFNSYITLSNIFIISYLILTQLLLLLSFYPVGICLSLAILVWISKMLVISSSIVALYSKELGFYSDWFSVHLFEQNLPTLSTAFMLIDITNNLAHFYTTYTFVFYLKRLGFYLFWIYLVCLIV